MLEEFTIGDLVVPTSRQTLFSFGNIWDENLKNPNSQTKMGLGIIVEVNPLFMNGKFKVYWAKAKTFTREEPSSLLKINQ
tara:strand:+ start:1243 stop:1482 length:240 start_codon:yes stop_codon:yes gene_type:complete